MKSFVQLLLEFGSKLFYLLELCDFQSFHVSSCTCGELLLVLIPVLLEFLEVFLLLPQKFTHLDIIGIQ